jgi:hypothetical protein
VRVEPGVLALYAVSEKDNSTNIMVKFLELVETVPILVGAKAK